MTIAPWVAILVSLIGLIPGLYAFRTAWKNRSSEKGNVVFKNALDLLETYKEDADQLRIKLKNANQTIDKMAVKINQLNSDLADANMELRSLRIQVKTMSTHINGDKDESA